MIEIDPELDLQLTNELIVDTAAEIYDSLLEFVQQAQPVNSYRSMRVLPLVDSVTPYPEEVLGTLYGLTYGGNRCQAVIAGLDAVVSNEPVYWAGCIAGSIFYVKEEYYVDQNGNSSIKQAYAIMDRPHEAPNIKPNFDMLDLAPAKYSLMKRMTGWLFSHTNSA